MMGRRQVVRHWVLVPAFAGSSPADPAKLCKRKYHKPLRSEQSKRFIFMNRIDI